MKSIAYIVPYFGEMPSYFEFWLKSCERNPTITWLFFTDNKKEYRYPQNVKVTYMSFQELKERIQSIYDFKISLDTPYRLCDYKVAYGEIFSKELNEGKYDFWGYCDIDLIFGDIRFFLTDKILNEYERIGYLGHSSIYKNNKEVNSRYRELYKGKSLYKQFFTSKGNENNFFDEKWLELIYKSLNIDTYKETIFADISPLYWNFRINYQDEEGIIKNKHRIFTWENGKILSYSLFENSIIIDEFMYVHFLRRSILTNDIKNYGDKWLIVPNKILNLNSRIDESTIKRYSKNKMIVYWIDFIKRKWRKITIKKTINYIYNRIKVSKENI